MPAVARPLLTLALAAGCAGCGSAAPTKPLLDSRAAPTPTAVDGRVAAQRPHRNRPRPRRRPPVGCAGLPAPCRASFGKVIYVEKVDPDGDGDAHYVLSDRRSITLPGITAVDVARSLRPRRLPRVGEWVSAAGPVQTGSYGQQQIHALRVRHHRRARPRRG